MIRYKLIEHDVPSDLEIFNNRPDVIRWLELAEKEATLFWEETETEKKPDKTPHFLIQFCHF